VFNPNLEFINGTPVSIGATRQTTPAFPYGGGVDYHLFSRFALRLQYRGLFYRAPDFHTPVYLYTGAIGHMAEPSAGVVIRF
jgi:hypothetical protein